MTLKLVFTAFLLDVQHFRDSEEKASASSLVVPLEKALNSLTEFSHLSVVDRWPTTTKRARIAH